MYGYIYLTTNKVNNKKYIGQHRAKEFDTRYIGSGILLIKAIQLYGAENFETKILKECVDENDLNESEKYFISYYSADTSEEYYNIAKGGDGHTCSPWNKGLTGLSVTGKQLDNLRKGWHLPASDIQRKMLSKLRKGCIVTEKTRSLISKQSSDRVGINKDGKNKLVKKQDLETYLSNGWKKGYDINTDERVAKFKQNFQNRDTAKEKERRKKLSESISGRVWINNGIISKQIKLSDLDDYTNNGFVRGRLQSRRFID